MTAARDLFKSAIALDTGFGAAHAGLAYTYYADTVFAFNENYDSNHANGLAAAREAIALDAKDPVAHSYLGRLHTQAGAYEAAKAEFDLALSLNPNFAMARYGLGLALTFDGNGKEALIEIEAAIRMSPHDPQMWLFEMIASLAAATARDFETALAWSHKSIGHPQAGFYAYMAQAIAAAYLGQMDEARAAAAKVLELMPQFSVAFIRRAWPNWDEDAIATISKGLAMVGIGEETATD
jgi:lipoprotein NlpI